MRGGMGRNAWYQQRIWSLTPNRLRKMIDRARRIALALEFAQAGSG